jgi:hypothetical protein
MDISRFMYDASESAEDLSLSRPAFTHLMKGPNH